MLLSVISISVITIRGLIYLLFAAHCFFPLPGIKMSQHLQDFFHSYIVSWPTFANLEYFTDDTTLCRLTDSSQRIDIANDLCQVCQQFKPSLEKQPWLACHHLKHLLGTFSLREALGKDANSSLQNVLPAFHVAVKSWQGETPNCADPSAMHGATWTAMFLMNSSQPTELWRYGLSLCESISAVRLDCVHGMGHGMLLAAHLYKNPSFLLPQCGTIRYGADIFPRSTLNLGMVWYLAGFDVLDVRSCLNGVYDQYFEIANLAPGERIGLCLSEETPSASCFYQALLWNRIEYGVPFQDNATLLCEELESKTEKHRHLCRSIIF